LRRKEKLEEQERENGGAPAVCFFFNLLSLTKLIKINDEYGQKNTRKMS